PTPRAGDARSPYRAGGSGRSPDLGVRRMLPGHPPEPDPTPDAPRSTPTRARPEEPDVTASGCGARSWGRRPRSDHLAGRPRRPGRRCGGAFAIDADGERRRVLPTKLKLSADVPEAILTSELGR